MTSSAIMHPLHDDWDTFCDELTGPGFCDLNGTCLEDTIDYFEAQGAECDREGC